MRGAERLLNYGCPLCGGPIRIPVAEIGKDRACPNCGRDVAVQVDAVVPDPRRRRQLGLPEPTGPLAVNEFLAETRAALLPRGKGFGPIPLECSRCSRRMDVFPEHAGRDVRCPFCGHATSVHVDDLVPAPRPNTLRSRGISRKMSPAFALVFGLQSLAVLAVPFVVDGIPLDTFLGMGCILILFGPIGLLIALTHRKDARLEGAPRNLVLEAAYVICVLASIAPILLFAFFVLWPSFGTAPQSSG